MSKKATDPRPVSENQSVGTPWEFIRAVEARFGKILCDLAASKENAKGRIFITEEMNSLTHPWPVDPTGKHVNWLNPPFANIAPWAEKCSLNRSCRPLLLVPASIGSNWYQEFVEGHAREVLGINPRISFTGAPYPKDLMLVDYSPGCWLGVHQWRWKGHGLGGASVTSDTDSHYAVQGVER